MGDRNLICNCIPVEAYEEEFSEKEVVFV